MPDNHTIKNIEFLRNSGKPVSGVDSLNINNFIDRSQHKIAVKIENPFLSEKNSVSYSW